MTPDRIDDTYTLAKRIPDMRRGFQIITNYGAITIDFEEAGPIADVVREVIERRIAAYQEDHP